MRISLRPAEPGRSSFRLLSREWRTRSASGRPSSGPASSSMKELRPGSAGRSEIRILYIFDPRRNTVLLVAGDKAGKWEAWYRQAIPLAEQRYEDYLKQEDIR